MRTRIFWSIVGVAAVAVALFGVPLAIAADRLLKSQQMADLQRRAAQAANSVPETGLHAVGPILLPDVDDDFRLALYDQRGELVVGSGPPKGGPDVTAALKGRLSEVSSGSFLSVAVPLRDEDRTIGAARAAVPADLVWRRVRRMWLGMGAFAGAAVGVAAALARRQARALTAPVRDLETAAERLGEGDFSVRLGRYGIDDLDTVADAMDRTATRLGDLVERERSFSSAASHQLNTPLTTMRLALEGALLVPEADQRTAIAEAVEELEHLQDTVGGLLALTRDDVAVAAPCDPTTVCESTAARWRGALVSAGRLLTLDVEPDLPPVWCSEHALREALQVLLDNAVTHGQGVVTLRSRRAGSGVVIEVEDQGEGYIGNAEALFTPTEARRGHGIGLGLARRLMETQGGRLVVRRSGPNPVFMLAVSGQGPAKRAADRSTARRASS